MSEIPEDIARISRDTVILIEEATNVYWPDVVEEIIGNAISYERARCLSIVKAIDPHNEAEAHLIETIVRRIRGDE